MTLAASHQKQTGENDASFEVPIRLARINADLGSLEVALDFIHRAKAMGAPKISFLSLEGKVRAATGDIRGALTSLLVLAKIAPTDAQVLVQIASLLSENGEHEDETEWLKKAIHADPFMEEAYMLLALHVLDHAPHSNLFTKVRSYLECGYDERTLFRSVAKTLLNCGRYEDAWVFLDDHIGRDRFQPSEMLIVAELEMCMQNFSAAESYYRAAYQLDPDSYHMLMGLIKHLIRIGDPFQACSLFRKHISDRSNYRTPPLGPRREGFDEWLGQTLQGKSILLRTSRDNGDNIQYLRIARALKTMGATVVVESYPNTRELFCYMTGVDQVVDKHTDNLHVDFEAHPAIANLILDWDIDQTSPYISLPKHSRVRPMHAGVNDAKFHVALNWASAPMWLRDRNRFRSVPLRMFQRLAGLPNVILHSIQFGTAQRELSTISFPVNDLHVGDFFDTATVISHLDLVITTDTSVAHLAGAMGKECYLLLPYTSCWRWMLKRNDCALYPSVRIFRQSTPGDWSLPISEMCYSLPRL